MTFVVVVPVVAVPVVAPLAPVSPTETVPVAVLVAGAHDSETLMTGSESDDSGVPAGTFSAKLRCAPPATVTVIVHMSADAALGSAAMPMVAATRLAALTPVSRAVRPTPFRRVNARLRDPWFLPDRHPLSPPACRATRSLAVLTYTETRHCVLTPSSPVHHGFRSSLPAYARVCDGLSRMTVQRVMDFGREGGFRTYRAKSCVPPSGHLAHRRSEMFVCRRPQGCVPPARTSARLRARTCA